jgi:PQQ-dependent dehydrogenase (methanol/ethanol family)
MRRFSGAIALVLGAFGLINAACFPALGQGATAAAQIPSTAPGDWAGYGRTYDEQRFSPLEQINRATIRHLGLAWAGDLESDRGQEATPIVVGGRIFVATAWSKVRAYDAISGKLLWAYDPKVPGEWAVNACCDVVNRGVAYADGKIFVGTLDGRLIALSAATGKLVWTVNTIDRTKPYTITGAPRVIKGRVLIGNGGAEYGVRGYVSAYDVRTGKLSWRFYTVPGDPAKPFESKAMAEAAKTWSGEWWKLGGGGTAWDSMAYDPDLDLLYIGTGNGSPWNRQIRSDGKGDNLYLSSIVAVRPETGEYVWHYQVTPGDEWDYTATQHMILADIPIEGKIRKVLMQAPKNGFFYVLDRATGRLISAKPFVPVNWASEIDLKTGRPVENPLARYSLTGKPFLQMPSPAGGHSWYPMSFNPKTGLVYLPAQEISSVYAPDPDFKHQGKGWNLGVDLQGTPLPKDPAALDGIRRTIKGYLLAWDPVAQKEVWRQPHDGAFNGGTLSLAGGLVMQGDANGQLHAYAADDGKELWHFDGQSAITAPPISYAIKGRQYVAVVSGYGGIQGTGPGILVNPDRQRRNISRLLVFRLNGGAKLAAARAIDPLPPISVPPIAVSPQTMAEGRHLYGKYCAACHGAEVVSAGIVPDLRHSAALEAESFNAVVRDGVLKERGMVSFASEMGAAEIEKIRLYIIGTATMNSK